MEDEVILADLGVVERRLERLERDIKKGNTPELRKEQEILLRCREALESGRPLRALELGADDAKRLRGFQFLSAKPLLIVLNLDEADLAQRAGRGQAGRASRSSSSGAATRAVPICAKIELEIAQLDEADRAAFMADLGLHESGLDRVIRASYDLLGYISFFTVGEDECRAWSIPRETPAVLAAGEIHSDISRGFIRAEVVRYEHLLARGHARRLPRSRRAAAGRQGVHRPRRRRDQLPPRHVMPLAHPSWRVDDPIRSRRGED